MLWVLSRPGIKGGQQDKIRCCGPHPLERGLKQATRHWHADSARKPTVPMYAGRNVYQSHGPDLVIGGWRSAGERIDFAREVGYILQQLFTC